MMTLPEATSSYILRLGDWLKLDLQVNREAGFRAWRTQWVLYVSLSGLSTESPRKAGTSIDVVFSHKILTIVENLELAIE